MPSSVALLALAAHAAVRPRGAFGVPRRLAIQASLPAWLPFVARPGLGPPKAQRTNEVVARRHGMPQRRLGSTDIVVSQMGLGTQRWGSTDYNAPDEALCHRFLDVAVDRGINLVDTAEQYPIPSDSQRGKPEGLTEEIIGRWIAKDRGRRSKVVIASKITGGANVNRANILRDLEGSLRRLQTDYLDMYLLHWPARYTPQSNWGQSLMYDKEMESLPYYRNFASFEEIAGTMGELVLAGKIRAYGMCNDNAVGLCLTDAAAKALGVPGPAVMQNDFSLIDRRAEENGVSEAASPIHLNTGFLAYNVLAGGVLTGKYANEPASVDNPDQAQARRRLSHPRGRMDDLSWGPTLYRYRTAPAMAATRRYQAIADAAGISLTELGLRWCAARPVVTSSLLGFSTMEQLDADIRALTKGSLPEDVMWEIDRVHMRNRLPIFASERVGKDWYGEGEIGERIP